MLVILVLLVQNCCCLISLCLSGVLLTLVSLDNAPARSEDLSNKCRRALKSIVAKLTVLPALDALVHQQQLQDSVMKLVLEQVCHLIMVWYWQLTCCIIYSTSASRVATQPSTKQRLHFVQGTACRKTFT